MRKFERSGFSTSYRNDDEIAAMDELRQGLELYLDPDQILPLSAYKLQASRFRRGKSVQAAQGMQCSVGAELVWLLWLLFIGRNFGAPYLRAGAHFGLRSGNALRFYCFAAVRDLDLDYRLVGQCWFS